MRLGDRRPARTGAINDLYDALRSKDTALIYESIMALQKMRERTAGARIQFLLRDLDEKVQIAAIETTGLLQAKPSAPDLRDVLDRTGSARVRRAALTALAMLSVADNRPVYQRYFTDKDDALRAARRKACPVEEPGRPADARKGVQ